MNTKANIMQNTTFTTRIKPELKARLEQIAKYEDRSASYMANQAIQALVEEREATHGLVKTALELIDNAEIHDEKSVDAWLGSPAGNSFPKGQRAQLTYALGLS